MTARNFLRRSLFVLVAATVTPLSGASALSPLQSEGRVVTMNARADDALILNEPMVWLDQDIVAPTRGIRLPSGTYTMEAEDPDYIYYRSAAPIEYRVFHDGAVSDDRFMPGGIYLSKAAITLVPAGVYLTVDDTHKTLTWKLGLSFVRAEGSKWTHKKAAAEQ